jgi:hypothetical protein
VTNDVFIELLQVQHPSRTPSYLLLSMESCLIPATAAMSFCDRPLRSLLDSHNIAIARSERERDREREQRRNISVFLLLRVMALLDG